MPPPNKALQRFLEVEWTPQEQHARSQIFLIKEYMRRMALWANALNATKYWPFFDVIEQIDPSLSVPQTALFQFEKSVQGKYLKSFVKWSGEWYLRWSAHNHEPQIAAYNLPEPYEPLIISYERSGAFYVEHGKWLTTPGGTIHLRNWEDFNQPQPIVELDNLILDRLDLENGNVKRSS
jgi:hypothetical protein